MSATVNMSPNGLTNAFLLGVLDKNHFDDLSNQFNNTFAVLWIHLDVKENVRHLSYYDAQSVDSLKQFEITLSEQNIRSKNHLASWNIFF